MSTIQFLSVGDKSSNGYLPIGNSSPTVMNFYNNRNVVEQFYRGAFVNGLITPTNKFNIVGDYTVSGSTFTGGGVVNLLQRCTTSGISSAAADFTLTVKRKPGLNVVGSFGVGLLTNSADPSPLSNYIYGLVVAASATDQPTTISKQELTVRTVAVASPLAKQANIDVLYRIQRLGNVVKGAYSLDDGNVWIDINIYPPSTALVYPSLYSDANQGIVVVESVGFSGTNPPPVN